jgi:hypothetical protein
VTVGERPCYQPVQGGARAEAPRAALLDALASLARRRDFRASEHRKSASRRRDAGRKASDTREAVAEETKAATVRALAVQVAAMWPEAGA